MLIPDPREHDQAAIMDDASPLHRFFFIILPLLRPPVVTVVVTSSVTIFNGFVGPLHFLPGVKDVTTPLTSFSFISQFGSRWNLRFAHVIVIAIILLIIFISFQRQLVSGMTSAAVKGSPHDNAQVGLGITDVALVSGTLVWAP